MPSIPSILLREYIRLIKPIVKRFSVGAARFFQDRLGDLGTIFVADEVEFIPVKMGGFEACFVKPKALDQTDKRVILYLHGGGYVAGQLKYARGFASVLARELKQRVFTVAYRLAPEHPFPAAIDDAFAAYNYLLGEGYAGKDISFIGESAGGGLVFALCLLIKQRQLALPARLVGISPWVDLTFSGESYKTNEKKDPSLTEKTLRSNAAAYAKGQEENPLVSPIFGDLNGLPPALLFAGGDELLLSDAKMLLNRLVVSGGECELVVAEGLWHVYVLYRTPEANQALKKIAEFLEPEV